MAGNYQNILDHRDCIPEERMLAYIGGKLSPQEANQVEQHLLECELCSDALEGLKMLPPDKARVITAELNSKIDQRIAETGKAGKVLPFGSFYRLAAVFVLAALFGGGYLLVKDSKEKNSIALNQQLQPAVNKDSTVIQFEAPAGSVSQKEESTPLKKEIRFSPPPISHDQGEDTVQSLAYSPVIESKDDSKPLVEVSKTENGNIKSQSDSFYNGNEVAMSKVEISNANQKQASNAIEDYHSSQAAPASTETNSADMSSFEMSAKKASKSKNVSDSTYLNSIFLQAKSNYDQKNFDLAANDFEKLVKDTTSKYYDDSKWYLANCYMRTNRNTKARTLLQEISNSNSIHKKEAFGLLQE
jgi:hypothetical protein